MKKLLSIIFLGTLLLASFSCQKRSVEKLPEITDTFSTPYQEVVGPSTLFSYDSSRLLWRLDTRYSRRNIDDTSSSLVVPVALIVYDNPSNGKRETKVFSDSGRTGKGLEKFYIWGNVLVKNWDGLTVKSQSMAWDKRTHMITSFDFVEIRTPSGDILRGKGLDATETFSTWSLRENVSGRFPNFKERLDKGKGF